MSDIPDTSPMHVDPDNVIIHWSNENGGRHSPASSTPENLLPSTTTVMNLNSSTTTLRSPLLHPGP